MYHGGSCHLLEVLDAHFGFSVLVVSVDARKGKALPFCVAVAHPVVRGLLDYGDTRRSSDLTLSTIDGSLHFLGSLDLDATWGMGLVSVRIGVARTPS